jgi:hypothetical protein
VIEEKTMTPTTTRILAAVFVLSATATLAGASDHGFGRGGREDDEEHEHEGRERQREGGRSGDGASRGRAATAATPAADPGAAALYRKECGACHLAFPPGLLSAESHRRTLAGLEKHFGQNAELDPATTARLERYLVDASADAGTHRKSGKMLASLDRSAAPLRITEVPYFQRKHRKIGADVVARPAVRSLANCAACHAGAADWDFDEDRVKIPR